MVRVARWSVAIGLAVMIVSISVIIGFRSEISSKVIGFGADVQIVNLDGNSSLETEPIDANQPFLDKIRELPDFKHLQRFAVKAGILRGEEAMQGVVLKGVGTDFDWAFFRSNLTDGAIPSLSDSIRTKDVIISATLARKMELGVGDKFELMFVEDPPRRDRFTVCGIYESGLAEMDEVMIIGDISAVQRLNKWSADQITGFEVTTKNFDQIDNFTSEIASITAADEVYTMSIMERYPQIFGWLLLLDVNALIIITIMLVVGGFNMIAGLLIILLEKTSMIGLLKSMGMAGGQLQRIFLYQSAYIIGGGLVRGNAIGLTICALQYYFHIIKVESSAYMLTVVPVEFNWGYILLLNVATFAVILALLTLPTLIIGRIRPEKTIRFE